jgi:hypothetical protein
LLKIWLKNKIKSIVYWEMRWNYGKFRKTPF